MPNSSLQKVQPKYQPRHEHFFSTDFFDVFFIKRNLKTLDNYFLNKLVHNSVDIEFQIGRDIAGFLYKKGRGVWGETMTPK